MTVEQNGWQPNPESTINDLSEQNLMIENLWAHYTMETNDRSIHLFFNLSNTSSSLSKDTLKLKAARGNPDDHALESDLVL
jgi:hypothetical protein